jgi:uncharacterized membrane protein YkoI
MWRIAILPALICAAGLLAATPALADPPSDKADQPGKSGKPDKGDKKKESSAQALDAAVERAERKYDARVIRTDQATIDGRPAYLLRLLSKDGRMWTVRVDAESGAEF